jgi:hypothetical protein
MIKKEGKKKERKKKRREEEKNIEKYSQRFQECQTRQGTLGSV